MKKCILGILAILFISCEYQNNKQNTKPHTNLSATEIETAIRNLEEIEWAAASSKKDKHWFEQHLADELIMTTGRTGEVTGKQQVIDEIIDTAYGSGNGDKLEDLKVLPLINSGVATFKIISNGKDKTGPYIRIARYTEVWVFKNNRWQLMASHSSLLPDSLEKQQLLQ